MEHYEERDRESKFSGTGPTLLVDDEKLKDPTDMANTVNNKFITITG
jgi:hypothetical protein